MFAQIARLAAPGATASTYTVAASVRERLQRAGFTVRKAPGFARKRDMLCARYERNDRRDLRRISPSRVIVIGAGLAGSACAARLAAGGFDVQVIERHAAPAAEASGNPAGLVMPAFSLDWNLPTRLTVSAFLHARRRLTPFARAAWFPTGVLQLARDDAHLARHERIIERYCLSAELLHIVSAQEGSALVGQRVANAGWWLPGAGWAAPAQICRNDLAGLRVFFGRHVAQLRRARDEQWEALDASDVVIARAPLVILANAHAAGQLLGHRGLPLVVTRGQVSFVTQPAGAVLHAPVCREGFVIPAVGGLHCIGSSYEVGVDDLDERVDDHLGNLERLRRLLPDYAADADPGALAGRVALRAVAPDRMPVVGPSGDHEARGLYACLGLASRGLTYAPLLAESLACMISGEPLPIERGLAGRMDPRRFRRTLQT
jgi:tRNA 5-methylaminomethyl-2-thiouridine biosynthesis bifunctional protein